MEDAPCRFSARIVNRCIFFVVVLLVVVQVIASPSEPAAIVTDQCDWSVSGLESVLQRPSDDAAGKPSHQQQVGADRPHRDERGAVVQPVYLRCSQGTIRWAYPRGALRLVLRLRSGNDGRDFKGCIRAGAEFEGASIYVEGKRRLHPLLSPGRDGKDLRLPRCFHSRGGQAALYVEADVTETDVTLNKMVAEFSYDLLQLAAPTTTHVRDPLEECRPCSEDEMLYLYCVSDFVAHGVIHSLRDNPSLDRTELRVRAKRVIRDTSEEPVFTRDSSEEVVDGGQHHLLMGTLHVPLECGARLGEGEFVFMGRLVLGSPRVWCAPRMEDWKRFRRKAEARGERQCTLD